MQTASQLGLDLFGTSGLGPPGFEYQPELITQCEEADLAAQLASLPFAPFDFHGHLANRRVVGFGHRYDYASRQIRQAEPIPDFLLDLRRRVGLFAGQPAEAFEQLLINEYQPGAGIGWHRDKPQFGEVVGVSLLSACALRFRQKEGTEWRRVSVPVAPRSAYLLSGAARQDWEHSITPLDQHRYSLTFRTLARERGHKARP